MNAVFSISATICTLQEILCLPYVGPKKSVFERKLCTLYSVTTGFCKKQNKKNLYLGLRPRDFPRAQSIFYRVSLLSS